MSYHFQPRGDFSDESEDVDLAAWQKAKQAKDSSPRPPAHLDLTDGGLGNEEEDIIAELSNGLPETQLADAAIATAFTAAAGHMRSTQDTPGSEKAPAVLATPSKELSAQTDPHDNEAEDVYVSTGSGFTSINKPNDYPTNSREDVHAEYSVSQFEGIEAEQKGRFIPTITGVETDVDDYEDYTAGSDVVRAVLEATVSKRSQMIYTVEYEDRHTEEIPLDVLVLNVYGVEALDAFESQQALRAGSRRGRKPGMSSTRPGSASHRPSGFVDPADVISMSEDEASDEENARPQLLHRKRKHIDDQYDEQVAQSSDDDDTSMIVDEDGYRGRRLRKKQSVGHRTLRSAGRPSLADQLDYKDDDEMSDTLPYLDSDLPGTRRRRRKLRLRGIKQADHSENGIEYVKSKKKRDHVAVRQSGRTTRHQGLMEEVGEDDIYRAAGGNAPVQKPKIVGAREHFKTLPNNNEFKLRHIRNCETCGQGTNYAPLVYCQGCVLAYHKSCLGPRNSREHLVTKTDDEQSVLQCRRCIAYAKRKLFTAPDQGKCSDCQKHGRACQPFRPRKTVAQEQKERDENGGVDPTYEVHPSRINQANNLLFRCLTCWRGFHFEHLPSRSNIMDIDSEINIEQRIREYSRDFMCKDCLDMPAKIGGLIAWKPIDEDTYDPAKNYEEIEEDNKAYLVKWDGMSYFRAMWMPGAWVWGVSAASMRKAFAKRDDSLHPKMRTEDAIPEDYLRTDIVLDIKYTSIVDIRTEEVDKARIREIDKALIKYKGLRYEDAVWEKPPVPEDDERWTDFVTAYNDWVRGRYVRIPARSSLKNRIEKARAQATQFEAKLEKKIQPETVEGGELMKYQIDGLNWLYFKWIKQENAILADEMGLGKTIQVIAFLATLVADWNCFPFLIVVPNSTCPNWRREIKRWAPSLRVVAYYGSKESRDLAYRYELYPENSKDLRCHIVVTSYDAASSDDLQSRKFFRSVSWQGLIVDEGQRLKNDSNLLYAALGQLKVPFRLLMTGTPLQNNQRELFNLLHFLDESINAAQTEAEYANLDQSMITKLHDMIRPFFLRRTKAQVLTFLPPMAQIILPVSMTIVQKKLYRTILAKNPELMKSIFSTETSLAKTERASLNNILMQLRKCLCHPFVYSKSIEERGLPPAHSHRNLVDASSKLLLLETLLPKLQDRGHRVLIFSQFLDMLDIVEDFLDGMALRYQRLDGTISSLTKQKRIDEFNAPDSPMFAFLLSTRAGGVGINLATADTVIILDPDFNPHQDIQALSRAHRIGQHKKVLCFQLVTRDSAEEKIMQMGRKKLALDHVLIQEMDADDADQTDLVSVLRHGANKIFEDGAEQDIVYDPAGVDQLLDRSHIEGAIGEQSAENQFSFARVWASDTGTLQDQVGNEQAERDAPDPGVWVKILKERERVAAEEAAAKAEAFGRGRRARINVDYVKDKLAEGGVDGEGLERIHLASAKRRNEEGDESDTDFLDDGDEDEDPFGESLSLDEAEVAQDAEAIVNAKSTVAGQKPGPPTFKRAVVPQKVYVPYDQYLPPIGEPGLSLPDQAIPVPSAEALNCVACRTYHRVGSCPLRLAGVEFCNLCGLAHYGNLRVCPHIQSETQVRQMLEALRFSNEPEHLVKEAKRYLKGLKGNLVQLKKQKELHRQAAREVQAAQNFVQARGPIWRL